MELIDDNTDFSFKSSNEFSEKLNTLKQQLPHVLDDFEKYYVFYNMNSTNSEYQRMFENIKNNLNSINSQAFMLSNSVESEINDVNKRLISLDMLIKKEKETNTKLKLELGVIKEKENSADIMISNYKQLYDIGYLKNWAMFLSILAAGFAISKISSNKLLVV